MRKIFKRIACLLAAAVFFLVMAVFLRAQITGEPPRILGYSVLAVVSESMEPEIMKGELILIKDTQANELQVGDVVTYKGEGELEGMLITHKVVRAAYKEGGTVMLQTSGISAYSTPDDPFEAQRLCGRVLGVVPALDKVYAFLMQPLGFLVVIVTPLCIIIVQETLTVVKDWKKGDRDNETISKKKR